MEIIQHEVKEFLATEPKEATLEEFVKNYQPSTLKPKAYLHQLDLKELMEPQLVYATLMVQDIREGYFYYPILVKKPINKNSEFCFSKFSYPEENIGSMV